MRHLSIHESTANTQHTHNHCIFYATRVQHVRVSGRPGVPSEELRACLLLHGIAHQWGKKKKQKKETEKHARLCDSYLPFDYDSAILSPARSYPVQ